MRSRGRRLWVIAAVVAGAVSACTSDDASTPTETSSPTPTTVTPRIDDGVLQIGVLLPASGEGSAFGQSARAAIRVAVDLANAEGGVNGQEVELFVRDEGGDVVTAAERLQQLIEAQVDVIIGPASSNIAIALLPTIVEAGIATCSPSASALALDDFPDNNLFFRTIPSDSLQADAIAEVIEQTGRRSAAIAYVDDGYGRPLEEALQSSLDERGITVTDSVGFAVDDDEFLTEAQRLVDSGDGALALLGDSDAGTRMLAALADALDENPRPIVVNDTLRQPWSLGLQASIRTPTRERIRGVSQLVLSTNAELLEAMQFKDPNASGLYADQAFNCANLLMLSAQQAGSTHPDEIASLIPDVSADGSVCTSFAGCLALVDQSRNIDYDGPGGVLTLGGSGDPITALFSEFAFDATGRDVSVEQTVSGAR